MKICGIIELWIQNIMTMTLAGANIAMWQCYGFSYAQADSCRPSSFPHSSLHSQKEKHGIVYL